MNKKEENINTQDLSGMMSSLLRNPQGGGLKNLFTEIVTNIKVGETKTSSHCYVLNLDGNNQPRIKDLVEYLADEITRYCIPRKEFESARQKDLEVGAGSSTYVARVVKKAHTLFVKKGIPGEVGELLLYCLLEEILSIPQIFCKMPHKTNTDVHYHGIDGIHASTEKRNDKNILALYWGEAKLRGRLSDAVKDAVESLKDFLLSGADPRPVNDRDLQLMRDNLSVLNPELEDALVSYLDRDGQNYGAAIYKGAALVGFDSDHYPTVPNSDTSIELIKEQVTAQLKSWISSLNTQISNHINLDTFEIHIFLIPFPDVEALKKAFLKELGLT